MNTFHKFLSIIIVCSTAVTFSTVAVQDVSQRELSVFLTQAVVGVNKQTPMTLDAETRLDFAATARDLIIYNNTMVNYAANELDSIVFSKSLQELVILPLCDKPELSVFKDLKVTMVYRYLGKNGGFITELSQDMAECE